jgi:FtsZ-interacting cell division protein YlmF
MSELIQIVKENLINSHQFEKVEEIVDRVIDEEIFRLDLEGMKKWELQRREETTDVLRGLKTSIAKALRELTSGR